ncbi:MAG: serine hydrolase [Oscillospiraceae bacterium]|nr:serine hydrolase [Oscillospiraceae bacterium]
MIRRLAAALLVLLILGGAVSAAYEGTIEERVAQFMADRRLNEYNFAVSYYDCETGERFDFNETRMMVAASTFKLPLNLYYYELEQAGEISPDAYIPNSGTTLRNCHRMSLVDSNNDVSIAMLYNLGDFRTYKQKMRKYFTMTDEEITTPYWADNNYCTRMMTDALLYLYERQEQFPEMLDYMKQSCPGRYFKKRLDCEIAHKFGSFEGAENDVGIIYGDHPFLLSVFTMQAGENVSADAAVLFRDYTDERAAQREEAARLAAEQAAAEAAATKVAEKSQPVTVTLDRPAQDEPLPEAEAESAFAWWMIPVALGVFLAGSGLVLLLLRIGKRRRIRS